MTQSSTLIAITNPNGNSNLLTHNHYKEDFERAGVTAYNFREHPFFIQTVRNAHAHIQQLRTLVYHETASQGEFNELQFLTGQHDPLHNWLFYQLTPVPQNQPWQFHTHTAGAVTIQKLHPTTPEQLDAVQFGRKAVISFGRPAHLRKQATPAPSTTTDIYEPLIA